MSISAPSPAQILIVVVAAAVAGAFLLLRWLNEKEWKNPLALGPDWLDQTKFDATLDNLTDEDVSTLLLERIDKLASELNAARSASNAQATTLLGFLGGGVSVLAVLAKGGHVVAPVTALLSAGAAALFASLAYSLAVLWAKPRTASYGLDNFCRADFLEDPANRAVLAARVCHNGVEQTVDLFQDAEDKGRNLEKAQFFFVLGAALLVINVFVQ